MKSDKYKISLIVVAAIMLFTVSNSLVFILQSNQPEMSAMIRSAAFVTVLYGWALVRVLSGKRFAIPFMDFINLVYGMGFVSNIALAVTKLSGINVMTIVLMSVLGIAVNVLASISARRFRNDKKVVTN